jgi:hypothetical protein
MIPNCPERAWAQNNSIIPVAAEYVVTGAQLSLSVGLREVTLNGRSVKRVAKAAPCVSSCAASKQTAIGLTAGIRSLGLGWPLSGRVINVENCCR